jgi:hypothetical protein
MVWFKTSESQVHHSILLVQPQLFPSDAMRHRLGPDRTCNYALGGFNALVHYPKDLRRGPTYDGLNGANQKENGQGCGGDCHKQKQEDDEGREHLLDIIDVQCRHCDKAQADPNPRLPVYRERLMGQLLE